MSTKILKPVLCLSILTLMALLSACQGWSQQQTPEAEVSPEEINFYNWDNYMDPNILSNFEKEYNIKVNYGTYTSSRDLRKRLKENPEAFDLFIDSDYAVSILQWDGLLAPLNKANIPNMKNLDPLFVSPQYDPDNRYCVPYQWGTTAIAYNRKATGRDLDSWGDLFDPQFKGRVSFVESNRTAVGGVLLYLGFSPNTTNESEIYQARDYLIEHIDQFYTLRGDDGQDLLVNGIVDVAVEYSGDVMQIAAENPDIKYVIPKEGAVLWTDNMCISVASPHKEQTEKLINYMMDPHIGAQLSNYIRYASPNQAALPFIEQSDLANPIIYPPTNIRYRLFYVVDVGQEANNIYDAAFEMILAAHDALK
ncbi:MAG TPA: spermidine/putrescine ABC transporter substrate-binding protein [Anaerolineales bacterium]|nr:spermidine/putrescine ABC transporter substrate-binding protein [Anaerolineales bacterium]HUM25483.1 spermidine/putrescine ABC transporter substrate-binding protein [Anaerolineales bacterium]